MRFVLVHGGFHGAWCWERVIPELAKLGHEALAIDLPGHGTRRDEDSTLEGRRDAILEVMEQDDVLVGHSGGGFDITLAADAAPDRVGALVYLAGGLPIEGRPLVEATEGKARGGEVDQLAGPIPTAALRPDARGWLEWTDRDAARELFYHDCPDDVVDAAFARLTAAPPGILVEPVSVPRFWAADLPRGFLLCLEDRAMPFAMAMAFAGRLGVIPQVIGGSHSPFLSRPAELAAKLVATARTAPVAPLQPYPGT